MTELCNRKVSSKRCLHSFFTNNTNASMRLLNHGDIVTAIANACNYFASHLFDFLSNLSLLHRRAPADADRLSLTCNFKEKFSKLFFC